MSLDNTMPFDTTFKDKTLLVTGGTGSFGHAVLQRFLRSDCAQVLIFSRDEKKQDDMRNAIHDPRVKFLIGDVRDYTSVLEAFRGVDYVFHAAALKQVPSCEFHPMEAVRTNIMGADNVLRAAMERGVSRCVLLSTDKAVYPVNAMGMSKALMEKAAIAAARLTTPDDCVQCVTRYGNVMESRGSVIPLFLQQMLDGKPLTVTDPAMTRFLMTLEESVDLVVYAFEHALPGDIFVQKAPAAAMGDLAEAMRQLLDPARPVQVIGTRHGEKLYETLVSREEMARAEDHGRYFRIPSDARDLNYGKYLVEGQSRINLLEDYTSHNTARMTVQQIQDALRQLPSIQQALKTVS
jgi:UDP-N-acetylglucosamine 4,6-dehydratase